jgi:cell division septation protein DedD
VKVFEEERELTVMLLVDVSGSLDFGTQVQMKRDMVTEIAATIAFSAIQNNDKIGVVFFSDKIEKYIPPKKGRKHILYIIREMLDFKPESRRTDVRQAIEFMTSVQKRRTTTFVGSSRSAAPIDETRGTPASVAARISAALQSTESIASTTQSKRESEKPSGIPSGYRAANASTSQAGFTARIRSRIASTFGLPIVAAIAGHCLLTFDGTTTSSSTRASAPTPVRASASAHQLPTPPTPTTATREAARRLIASSPRSAADLEKSGIIFCSSGRMR